MLYGTIHFFFFQCIFYWVSISAFLVSSQLLTVPPSQSLFSEVAWQFALAKSRNERVYSYFFFLLTRVFASSAVIFERETRGWAYFSLFLSFFCPSDAPLHALEGRELTRLPCLCCHLSVCPVFIKAHPVSLIMPRASTFIHLFIFFPLAWSDAHFWAFAAYPSSFAFILLSWR